MAKVLCTLPNASDEISGVEFTEQSNGMLSAEISAEQAAAFCAVPGYALVEEQSEAADAELAAAVAEAKALGIEVKGNWKLARVSAEIARIKPA